MTFNAIANDKDGAAIPLRDQIITAARRDAKGSMSHARFFFTFVSLFLGLVLTYASIFYVPAFLDIQKVMGVSTEKVKLPAIESDDGKLGSYTNFFKVRRGYLRKGQALTLEYDLSPGTIITANISRCSAPPVIEVFYCRNIEGQQVKIASSTAGKRSFFMRKAGFYYFDEVITYRDGSETDKEYNVTWSRRASDPV